MYNSFQLSAKLILSKVFSPSLVNHIFINIINNNVPLKEVKSIIKNIKCLIIQQETF